MGGGGSGVGRGVEGGEKELTRGWNREHHVCSNKQKMSINTKLE